MGTQSSTRYQWPDIELDLPCTSGPLTVFPIVGGAGLIGDYLLLADAVDAGTAIVKEVDEAGHVPVILIDNRGKLPVLGIQGEEYVGSKQNRTLNVSVLAGPGVTEIPVTCVEEGRWDAAFRDFSVGAFEPTAIRCMKAQHTGKTRRADATMRFSADQSAVWDAVSESAERHGVASGTGAMHDVYNAPHVSDRLDKIIGGVVLSPDSRGAVVAMGGRIVAADLFESPDVFGTIWPRMLGSFALSSLHTKGVPPSLEAAESFISKPKSLTWNATPSVGLGEEVRWEDTHDLAMALVWQDRVLHASVFGRERTL